MLVNVDAKALEWYAAVFLSQDPVGMKELIDGKVDQHTDNQQRLGLPSRLIAKVFLFRLIFGGSAYAYAQDADFMAVGWSAKKWQKAIDTFYDKYGGLYEWHGKLMSEVNLTGKLIMPTGRIYTYERYSKQRELIYPRTQILNYPVQGLGADLMTIARILLWTYMKTDHLPWKLISTVHDSILLDILKKDVDKVVEVLYNVWTEIPKEFEKRFSTPFNLPMRCEVQIGENWGSMEDVKL